MTRAAYLVLADGRVFAGERFGAAGETIGEVVFNTSMTGYQEILTDPSYHGQIVCMTYPLIGNTGVNGEDIESRRIFAQGFVVRSRSLVTSSWRATNSLDDYLADNGVPGLCELDTRALTRHLREHGAQMGIIGEGDPQELQARLSRAPGIVGRDLVREVTCEVGYDFAEGPWDLDAGYGSSPDAGKRPRVVALDFGVKSNILRMLVGAGMDVTVMPANASAEDVLARKPDGVFLSNGPGDPEPLEYAAKTVRGLVGKTPIFGICLGHQILGLALGGKTRKLKFGHHGANQPVKDHLTGRVEITSQNHNYVVDPDTLPDRLIVPTHTNLNDGTNEGLAHRELPVFSVQYHPEASPGPHDASPLFARFVEMIRTGEPVVK
ncbi:glutamine-hydrolyzing carbamoyl-phosphate synthase small subunit [bacterium]|nr:glutamine-hydrolyzing carbamoyl-phosphate synthase small subunit [bacterium]